MKVLLEVEAQILAEGREWTRQRLEERLQAQADQIGALCPQSGLVLKYVRMREFITDDLRWHSEGASCLWFFERHAAVAFSGTRTVGVESLLACQPATTAEALL